MSATIHFLQKEIKTAIMSTDVYVGIASNNSDNSILPEINKDLDHCFAMFSDFEQKYSRFIKDNELYAFNLASGWIDVSPELCELLQLATKYYQYTSGIFDISVYKKLIAEGYDQSFKDKSSIKYESEIGESNLIDLKFAAGKVYKPKDLLIELGGIGKGYIVKKVTEFLSQKYHNFVVDAGGDIYFSGVDVKNGYNYWASDLEHPLDVNKTLLTLVVSNKGVATSGINKRKWIKNHEQKNHLINPKTGQSVTGNILSVTVVADDIVFADIMAKTLLIMGQKNGLKFCEQQKIAALFVDTDANLFLSHAINQYVWQSS